MTQLRITALLWFGIVLGWLAPLAIAEAAEIGGAVYAFGREADGQYHLRGYACVRKGTPSQQANHPSIEVYLDAPVIYGGGQVQPGSGTLAKTGTADQPGSTREEAVACDYVHDDSPAEGFWRSMRFDLVFPTAELAPLAGRKLFVSGVYRASATAVDEDQLANSPVTIPALDLPPLTVTCMPTSANPSPNERVTFKATATGGSGVYQFTWKDDSTPPQTAATGASPEWTPDTYSTSGKRTVEVTVRDNSAQQKQAVSSCDVTFQLAIDSAVLPSGRSVRVGKTVTANFAAGVRSADEKAANCTIKPVASDLRGVPESSPFTFWQTDAQNQIVGSPNQPFNLPASEIMTFVIALALAGPLDSTEVGIDVTCAGDDPSHRGIARSAKKIGINTLRLEVADVPVPDVIAVAVTPSAPPDGVLRVATRSFGAFAVAATNLGAASGLAAFVSDTSGQLPFETLLICLTDVKTGACLSGPVPGGVLLTLNSCEPTNPPDPSDPACSPGPPATLSVFAGPRADIPLDPERNRVIVEFKDFFGTVRGRTSVAVCAAPAAKCTSSRP